MKLILRVGSARQERRETYIYTQRDRTAHKKHYSTFMTSIVETFNAQLSAFENELTEGTHIQAVDLIGPQGNKLDYKAYAAIFATKELADHLRGRLKDMAELGLIVAIDGPTYRDISLGSRQAARRLIKDFTRHNDKLGFDFDNKTKTYKVGFGP